MVPISLNECESLKAKGLGGVFDLLRDSRVVARSKMSGPGEVAEVREDGEVEIYGFLVMILETSVRRDAADDLRRAFTRSTDPA